MSTFAFSDLHSQYNLWEQIKNYIKPSDTVFCLGDTIDRGDCAFEIFNEIMATPNIILLRGNHENFICTIGKEFLNYPANFIPYGTRRMNIWLYNGAEKTIDAFFKMTIEERKALIDKINNLPTHIEYTNKNGDIIYLCHAGRQPYDIEKINIDGSNFIWDRTHLMDEEWFGKENEYCVHGHTPVSYMDYYTMNSNPYDITKIYRYCKGHKINIDLGSFETHTACLLNLDTFEPIYFKDRTIIKEDNNE